MEITLTLCDAFDRIHNGLQQWQSQRSDADAVALIADTADQFRSIAEAAREASQPDWAKLGERLSQLTQLLPQFADSDEATQLLSLVNDGANCLQQGLEGSDGATETRSAILDQIDTTWGECLELIAEQPTDGIADEYSWPNEPTDSSAPIVGLPANETTEPSSPAQIDLILSSLGGLASFSAAQQPSPSPSQPPLVDRNTPQVSESATAHLTAGQRDDDEGRESAYFSGELEGGTLAAHELEAVVLNDPEIRDAFLDDAQRGLSSIEGCLLAYESDPTNAQPLHQVCRELHTLKGASGSVGLDNLAKFLHQVEDDLQAACDNSGPIELQRIFQAIDAVRAQVNCCLEPEPSTAATPSAASNASNAVSSSRSTPSSGERFVDTSGSSQDSVRVKATQLDRLMDMLAELVMLRNRRDSRVEQLKSVHSELVTCVSRLRAYEENYSTALTISNAHAGHATPTNENNPPLRGALLKQRVSSLTEIANDLLELGGSLRELYEPVSEETTAMSRFIRNFRQELIQLRRVPIGGLFQRLQRSIRDAARAENKKVRLQLLGEQVGIESSLLQQLYEPLLHIVRNAVSHGIEPEDRRTAAGKAPTGTITLEAHGSSNMLVITVRDDGRGLDYDALRRRGVEMGLISPERPISRPELARLIFHAGFSTKTETSEISGRGVGMDVVATALERMHSWIEVDSVSGHGTSVRLLIPLHSVIEHVMVFRSGKQEFAIPTQSIKYAGDPRSVDTSEFPLTRFTRLFSQVESNSTDQPALLIVSHTPNPVDGNTDNSVDEELRLGILVDEIIGPEEVVVRPLPNMMARQPYLSGVTLSGTGDIMLILDSKQILRHGLSKHFSPIGNDHQDAPPESRSTRQRKRVLVVDDSRSSRRTLVRSLSRYDYEIDEASDGLEAVRRLKDTNYDLIFSDLEMPHMGGMELLREVRSSNKDSQTAFIIVSSRGEEQFRQQAKQLKVTDYLTKPVSEAIVSQAVDRLNQQQER
ncbi:MAG: response regulator [Planctomycetales bacterium]|nr:response regulator [Planctomycetales bacterium]